jgi:hypothetical protein
MGDLLPLYYGIMAGVTFAMAIGFWKLWNWVRVMMLGIIALSLVLMVTEVRLLFDAPAAGAISLTLVRVALSVLWLWYCCAVQCAMPFTDCPLKQRGLADNAFHFRHQSQVSLIKRLLPLRLLTWFPFLEADSWG